MVLQNTAPKLLPASSETNFTKGMAEFAKKLWNTYNRYLESHPISTQSVTAGSLFWGGDVICQSIEHFSPSPKKEGEDEHNTLEKHGWDFKRMARMSLFGFIFVGPACHWWYLLLDKRLPGKHATHVFTKVIADQSLFSPFYLSSFFLCCTLFEGKGLKDAKEKIKKDFIPTFMMDCAVWPAAQTFNFFVVPPMYRVLYISSVSLIWNAYLSRVQHR